MPRLPESALTWMIAPDTRGAWSRSAPRCSSRDQLVGPARVGPCRGECLGERRVEGLLLVRREAGAGRGASHLALDPVRLVGGLVEQRRAAVALLGADVGPDAAVGQCGDLAAARARRDPVLV